MNREIARLREIIGKDSGRVFGSSIHYVDEIGSTSDMARELAENGAETGTVVIAESQTNARGRMGRRWHSPPGGLWFSVVLRPPVMDFRLCTILFGYAISSVVGEFCHIPCGFHWINDIYSGGAKLGGILLESRYTGSRLEFVIAGIGINACFLSSAIVENLANPAVTIQDLTGSGIDRAFLLSEILKNLETIYDRFVSGELRELDDDMKRKCITPGRLVEVLFKPGELWKTGNALELLSDGGLLVEFADGTIPLYQVERIKIVF